MLLLLPLVATAAAPRGVEQRNHGDMLGCGEPRVVIPPSSKLPEGNLTLIAQDKSKGVTWVVRVDQPAASKNSGFQAGRSGAARHVGYMAIALPAEAGNHETALSPDGTLTASARIAVSALARRKACAGCKASNAGMRC